MFQAWSPFSDAVVHSRRIDGPISDAVNDARSYGEYGSRAACASKRVLAPPGRASLRKTIQASRASLQGMDRRAGPAASKVEIGTRAGWGPQERWKSNKAAARRPPSAVTPRFI